MDFTKIITSLDNLFKFLCFGGLIIMGVAVLYPNEMQREIDFTIIDYQKEQDILLKEVDNLKAELGIVAANIENAKTKAKKLAILKDSIKKSNSLNMAIELEKLNIKKDELQSDVQQEIGKTEKSTFDLTLKNISIESDKAKILKAQEYLDRYDCYFWWFIAIGFIMFVYGFYGWSKCQKNTDEMQDIQIQLAKRSLAAPDNHN